MTTKFKVVAKLTAEACMSGKNFKVWGTGTGHCYGCFPTMDAAKDHVDKLPCEDVLKGDLEIVRMF